MLSTQPPTGINRAHVRCPAACRLASILRRRCSPPAARPASAQTATKVTFILINDIYLMGDRRCRTASARGGFARLAAVVKAERAKGGHVMFAHGGDTLSPSLMSGIDRGAHIIALTNMIPPDIFVPGNHEFDFGKAIFLQAHGGGEVPALLPPTCAAPDGKPLPDFKDRDIVTLRRRAHRAHRRGLRRHAAHVEPRGPEIPADGRHHRRSRPTRCARKAPTSSSR